MPPTFNLNAPSGAVTAAPHFVARRLVRLLAFCNLQIIDCSFDAYVVVCVWLLHISAVIFVFLKFFVISLRAQRLRWSASHVTTTHAKINENDVTINEILHKIHPKSVKMEPRNIQNQQNWCLGAIRKWFWKQVEVDWSKPRPPEPARTLLCHVFGAIWEILGAILVPSWVPRGSKIDHFDTKSQQKSTKWGPGRGLKKSLEFWLNFDR